MSEGESENFLTWKIPLWQVVFGVAAAIAVKYFVMDTEKVSRGGNHHSKNSSTPTSPKPITKEIISNLPPTEQSVPPETIKEEQVQPLQESNQETISEDDEPYDPDYLFYDEPYTIEDNYTMRDAPFKMILVVNNELKMGKGKIAAQCGHATMGAYKLSKKYCKTALNCWERHGVAKVVVKVDQEQEMYDILQTAKAIGVVAYIVEDAGRTQIAAGSRTVLALGPAPALLLDQITGHLKLL